MEIGIETQGKDFMSDSPRYYLEYLFTETSTTIFPSETNMSVAGERIKSKALEPRKLTEAESFTTYNTWKSSLVYTMKKDARFLKFITGTESWLMKSDEDDRNIRGLTADPSSMDGGFSIDEKVANLKDFLDILSQFMPHFLSPQIISNSSGIESIWRMVREYYGFQQSEATFMKFIMIRREEDERPMRLYHRLLSHVHDSLLRKDSKMEHNGVVYNKDEVMSPTTDRMVVLRWLELLNPSLIPIVQRYFSHELRKRTLKDLQPQICESLDDLMSQLDQNQPVSVGYVQSNKFGRNNSSKKPAYFQNKKQSNRPSPPSCLWCRKTGKPSTHEISACRNLTRSEKEELADAFSDGVVHHVQTDNIEDDDYSGHQYYTNHPEDDG